MYQFSTAYINRLKHREISLAAIDGAHKESEKPRYGLSYLKEFTDTRLKEKTHKLNDLTTNSDSFYSHTPCSSYSFDRNTLIYESNVTSEIEANNHVHGTFYKGWRKNTAVIILPNWNSNGSSFNYLAKLFSVSGFSALRLSLPFHDQRKPADWNYSKYLVSADIGLTISSTRQAVLDVKCAIDWLIDQGYDNVALVGISIGSCIATITAAHDERVKSIAQILMASNFAEVVWTGIATEHIRNSLDEFTTLEDLKLMWSSISPDSYVPKLTKNSTEVYMLTGKYDPVFLPHLSHEMAALYRQESTSYRWDELNCGHYTLGDFRHAVNAFARTIYWISRN